MQGQPTLLLMAQHVRLAHKRLGARRARVPLGLGPVGVENHHLCRCHGLRLVLGDFGQEKGSRRFRPRQEVARCRCGAWGTR